MDSTGNEHRKLTSRSGKSKCLYSLVIKTALPCSYIGMTLSVGCCPELCHTQLSGAYVFLKGQGHPYSSSIFHVHSVTMSCINGCSDSLAKILLTLKHHVASLSQSWRSYLIEKNTLCILCQGHNFVMHKGILKLVKMFSCCIQLQVPVSRW